MRKVACFIFVAAALFLVPVASYASLADEDAPVPPPADKKVETECPAGSFKFQETCWVQGDCPEGEALYKPGVCVPIPNWQYAPPVEEPAPPAEEEKPK
ncbi:MAG: hypothetical protein ACAH80_06985 [Alphaproteobacteria bacterium]